ncbi:MAG: hypothetical protein NDJ89_07785 [Oligoflexia bacterium]|nr:hypothetical protein [Oligoflexia bacterium]
MKTMGLFAIGIMLSAPAFAGGIIGGGGEILPGARVSADTVLDIVNREVKPTALAYLNYLDQIDHPSLHRSMLRDKIPQLADLLRHVAIRAPHTGACLDPRRQTEADASATLAEGSGVICFSVERIIGKVSASTVSVQLLALGVHEVTHLLGFDEAASYDFQNLALLDFSAIGVYSARQLLNKSFNTLSSLLGMLDDGIASSSLNHVNLARIQILSDSLTPPFLTLPFQPLSQWNFKQVEVLHSVQRDLGEIRADKMGVPLLRSLRSRIADLQAETLW